MPRKTNVSAVFLIVFLLVLGGAAIIGGILYHKGELPLPFQTEHGTVWKTRRAAERDADKGESARAVTPSPGGNTESGIKSLKHGEVSPVLEPGRPASSRQDPAVELGMGLRYRVRILATTQNYKSEMGRARKFLADKGIETALEFRAGHYFLYTQEAFSSGNDEAVIRLWQRVKNLGKEYTQVSKTNWDFHDAYILRSRRSLVAAMMTEADLKERRGEAIEARALYMQSLSKNPNDAQRAAIVRKIESLCARTILGPRVWAGDPMTEAYEVQRGDHLINIGLRYKIPYGLVKRLNGLSSDGIHIGQKLKVVKGPLSVRISKKAFRLQLRLGGMPVKSFPVAIGVGDSAPTGSYTVTVKQKNPTFYPPPSKAGKMSIKTGGAVDNPLGSRWIGFGDHLGIHGTTEPESIGRNVSLGSIRMLNSDVELLFDCLVLGSTVDVTD
jgi:lipoprotein-anchoring transpeptidase ErfK/SrfK